MSEIVCQCHQLSRVYEEGVHRLPILHELELHVHAGEKIAIVGRSGSGKTTLLNLLGGLDRPSSGEVIIGETKLHTLNEANLGRFRNRHIGFVYQFHHLLPEFNALENIMMPLLIGKMSWQKAEQEAYQLLNQVGLSNRAQHKPGELSGGERQRVAVARALVTEPQVVLMDEPTGNLDQENANIILNLLDEMAQKRQCAFIIVTHDNAVSKHQDRVLQLIDGKLKAL